MTRTAAASAPRRPFGLAARVGLEALGAAAAGAVLTGVVQYAGGLDLLSRLDADHPRLHLGSLVLFLAISHLLMLGFGARRGRQLRDEHRQRRQAEDSVGRLRSTDRVTGLLNRAAFVDVMEETRAAGHAMSVVLFDLRGFSAVNEAFGHQVGDAVLTHVGQQLALACERGPWPTPATTPPSRSTGPALARVGDDWFGVLWTHPRPGAETGAAGATPVADRLLGWAEETLWRLHRPFDVAGVQLEVVVNAGLATGEEDCDPVDVLRRADAAVAAGRREGVPLRSFDAVLAQRSAQQLMLHGQLRQALERGELTTYYQPQVDCRTGRVSAVEALVRWRHPDLGLLAPAAFLDVAERSPLITGLTEAVIAAATRDVASWRADGHDLTVAVNLSARVLDEHLLPVLEEHLGRHGLSAAALELEVTETAALVDEEAAGSLLVELRRRGHRVTVDDFGTGHAGLTYLRTIPATTLKIDRTFVTGLSAAPRQQVLVSHLTSLAYQLGMDVVAEGVETAEDWATLRVLGCQRAQGYWLARPVPAAELLTVVAGLEGRLAVLGPGPGDPRRPGGTRIPATLPAATIATTASPGPGTGD